MGVSHPKQEVSHTKGIRTVGNTHFYFEAYRTIGMGPVRDWINDPQEGIESVRSALRFEIWKIFKEKGIEIPFPQRDLYIKSGLGGLSRSETPPVK